MLEEYFDFEENMIRNLDIICYVKQLDPEVIEMIRSEYGSIEAYARDFLDRNGHLNHTYELFERLISCRPREQVLLFHRFGLIDGVPKTLGEVASLLGISRERALQIESKCLRPICKIHRTHRIRDYLK